MQRTDARIDVMLIKKKKKVVLKLHFLPQRRLKEIDKHIQNARD